MFTGDGYYLRGAGMFMGGGYYLPKITNVIIFRGQCPLPRKVRSPETIFLYPRVYYIYRKSQVRGGGEGVRSKYYRAFLYKSFPLVDDFFIFCYNLLIVK